MTDLAKRTVDLPIKNLIGSTDRIMYIYAAANAQAQTATITFSDFVTYVKQALANT
jgi:hypothetical protein